MSCKHNYVLFHIMRFSTISAFYSEYNNISKLEEITMENLFTKYCIKKKIATLFLTMFYTSLLLVPITFT